MSETPNAFPRPNRPSLADFEDGMTLRDWFAGQALAGILAATRVDINEGVLAESCYLVADAMLKAREVRA